MRLATARPYDAWHYRVLVLSVVWLFRGSTPLWAVYLQYVIRVMIDFLRTMAFRQIKGSAELSENSLKTGASTEGYREESNITRKCPFSSWMCNLLELQRSLRHCWPTSPACERQPSDQREQLCPCNYGQVWVSWSCTLRSSCRCLVCTSRKQSAERT